MIPPIFFAKSYHQQPLRDKCAPVRINSLMFCLYRLLEIPYLDCFLANQLHQLSDGKRRINLAHRSLQVERSLRRDIGPASGLVLDSQARVGQDRWTVRQRGAQRRDKTGWADSSRRRRLGKDSDVRRRQRHSSRPPQDMAPAPPTRLVHEMVAARPNYAHVCE